MAGGKWSRSSFHCLLAGGKARRGLTGMQTALPLAHSLDGRPLVGQSSAAARRSQPGDRRSQGGDHRSLRERNGGGGGGRGAFTAWSLAGKASDEHWPLPPCVVLPSGGVESAPLRPSLPRRRHCREPLPVLLPVTPKRI